MRRENTGAGVDRQDELAVVAERVRRAAARGRARVEANAESLSAFLSFCVLYNFHLHGSLMLVALQSQQRRVAQPELASCLELLDGVAQRSLQFITDPNTAADRVAAVGLSAWVTLLYFGHGVTDIVSIIPSMIMLRTLQQYAERNSNDSLDEFLRNFNWLGDVVCQGVEQVFGMNGGAPRR